MLSFHANHRCNQSRRARTKQAPNSEVFSKQCLLNDINTVRLSMFTECYQKRPQQRLPIFLRSGNLLFKFFLIRCCKCSCACVWPCGYRACVRLKSECTRYAQAYLFWIFGVNLFLLSPYTHNMKCVSLF